MNGRLILGMIVFLAVVAIVLPPTVSLFLGQHNWYDIDAAGNQIPCQKCHADIYEELNQSGSNYHKNAGTPGVADEDDCRFCHQANESITYAKGDGTYQAGVEAHAASTISCAYCHLDPGVSGAPPAGGFGLANSTFYSNDTGSAAAHLDFVTSAATDPLLEDSNEACIACHTHVAVKINFTHYGAMEFDVNYNTLTGEYETSNYKINTSTGVTNVIWGNASGTGWVNTYPGSANWPGQ